MTVTAVAAVGSGESVYAALSPYLNGVVRTSDAAQLALVDAAAQSTNAAAGAITAAPPFLNPAIIDIGQRVAPSVATPESPTAQILTGDSATVIQSNAAVLFAAYLPALPASAFPQPVTPVIPPPAIVAATPRVAVVS